MIEHIAQQADISKASAARALEAALGAVTLTLKAGGTVSLVGFGSFLVGDRAPVSAEISALAPRLKSRHPRSPSFVRARHSKMP